jgi:endonuclease/exonuclease/phosphatase family metal-dependent hydrolase
MYPLLGLVIATLLFGCTKLNRPDPQSVKIVSGEANTVAAGRPDGLRVVTFNVHGQTGAAIAEAVVGDPALAGADVLCLQEVEEHPGQPVTSVVARALGMSWAFAPGYGLDERGAHGVSILSRFPLRDLDIIELPRHDVVFNSARRAALGATLQTPSGPVRVYAVHLDNRINPDARVRQIEPVIADAADQPVERVIIAGDLNTSPFRWLGGVIPLPVGGQLDRMERFVRSHGFATPATTSGQTSMWLNMRLDAVYVRGLRGGDVGVEQDVRISDHFPMWVDLGLTGS